MKFKFILFCVLPIQLLFCHEIKEYKAPLTLSDSDIAFILKNPDVKLACIPEIVRQTFILLSDFASDQEFDKDLKDFMTVIEKKSCVISRDGAMKAIFSTLRLLKKYEAEFPQAYLDSFCHMLYDYQRSLHKEEYVSHES